ncbi:hypothetical protein HDU76_004811, partial [Blyttiomyces sp. JEL0837]
MSNEDHIQPRSSPKRHPPSKSESAVQHDQPHKNPHHHNPAEKPHSTNLDDQDQFLFTYDCTVTKDIAMICLSFQRGTRLLMGLKKFPGAIGFELKRERQLVRASNARTFPPIECCLSISIDKLKRNHSHIMQFVEGKIDSVFGGLNTVTVVMKPYDSIEGDHRYKYIVFVVIDISPNHASHYSRFEDPVDYIQYVETRYQMGGNIGVIEPCLELDSIGRKIVQVSNPRKQLVIQND